MPGSPGEAGALEPSSLGAPAPSRGPITSSTRAGGRSGRAHILAAGRAGRLWLIWGEPRLFVQDSSPYLLLGCDLGDQCLAPHHGLGQAGKLALKAPSVLASLPIFLPMIEGAACDQLVKGLSLKRSSPPWRWEQEQEQGVSPQTINSSGIMGGAGGAQAWTRAEGGCPRELGTGL